MATLSLDISSELPKAIRWTEQMTRQLPFAVSQALNATAFDARRAINGATKQYFDRPARFTQNAFFVQRSTKRKLEALVYAEAAAGRDRARYLRYGIKGGDRVQKGFERKFLAEVVGTRRIPSNAQLIPTSLVKLNAQGNVSLATIKRIQKGLATKGSGTFFIGTPKGGDRKPGIYRRSKGQLFPYFIAINKRSSYSRRFPIVDIGSKVAGRRFGPYLRSSLEKALATAR
jgi:hypothetical protein